MSEPKVAENLASVIRWLIYLLNSARDSVHRAFMTIGIEHAEIHLGHRYKYAFVDTDVDIAAPKYILIRTPDSDIEQHFTVSVGSSGTAHAELFENPTVTVDGTPRTPINRNRRSTNMSAVLLFEDPTVTVDGLRLAHMDLGGAAVGQTRITGQESTRDEYVLDRAEEYIVKITVDADNTHVNISVDWYEDTPE